MIKYSLNSGKYLTLDTQAVEDILKEESIDEGEVCRMKVKITITGKVHDVGYRVFLLNQADSLLIERFDARNVYINDKQALVVLIEGDEEQVKEFIEFVKTNKPEKAVVENIKVEEYKKPIRTIDSYRSSIMIDQLNKIIQVGVNMVEKMDTMLGKQDEMLQKQDLMLQKQDLMLEKMDLMLKKQDEALLKMDQMLRKQDEMLQKQDTMLGKMDMMLKKQDETIEGLKEIGKKIDNVAEKVDVVSEKLDKVDICYGEEKNG